MTAELEPRRDGYMERNLALFPGWQLGAPQPRRSIARRDFLGVVARADRAPLGEVELDALTWLIARFYELGGPPDGWVPFTFYELGQDLYGRLGGRNRELMREALENLHAVVVTLSGVAVDTGEFHRKLVSKVHVLNSIVLDERLDRLQDGEPDVGPQDLGGVRGETIRVKLADWLMAQLVGGYCVRLDWRTQRRLGGLAKRLWLHLEAQIDRFTPLGDGSRKQLLMALDEDAMRGLGIECARERDNRAAVKRAARRLRKIDTCYVQLDLERAPTNPRLWRLRVVRDYRSGALLSSAR